MQVPYRKSEEITEQDGLVKGLVKELAESQIQILNMIEANNSITKKERADRIGIGTTAIDKHISKLKKMKIIERMGGRKEGYWKIIDQRQ